VITHGCARLLAAAVLGAVIVGPLHDVAVASDATTQSSAVAVRAVPAADRLAQPAPPASKGFVDAAARVSFDPPVGCRPSAARGEASARRAQYGLYPHRDHARSGKVHPLVRIPLGALLP
jgi:hypothetical protein